MQLHDDRGEVIGVNDAENWVRELHAFVTAQLNPAPLFSASIHKLDDTEVVMIDVPQGADKPYSLRRSIYVRVGQSTFKADPATAAEMVEVRATLRGRWEQDAVPGFVISDCDGRELMEARNELKRIGRLGSDVTEDDEELLRRLRLVRNGQYINAAVLLFASDPLTWSPNLAVRVVSYASDKSGPISNDVLLSGPGVRVLYVVITAIQQRTGFSGQFVSGKIQHRDVPAYSGQNPDKSGHGHL